MGPSLDYSLGAKTPYRNFDLQASTMMFLKATIISLLTSSIAVLGAPSCSDSPNVPVDDVQVCVDELHSENGDGTTTCEAISNGIELSGSGSATIWGTSSGVDSTTSYCGHVADSVQEIIDSCTKDGLTGGSNVAVGNGDFIVEVTSD
ncbi:hypothetical protein PHISCL_03304 [Aspergillus sclerotialis]|uniref:Ecp2 effector protein domain-containing protein n=1 Tax=Aspergillus sclerotialis TaxID=2070753 RepID=A0A3A2ZMW6_9EURO|nr:hypothetical protein PHISCL_03304 [Aspergillus sclerotialis]